MMEAVTVLAALLARYELSPAADPQGGGGGGFPRAKPLLTLRPESCGVAIRRRR